MAQSPQIDIQVCNHNYLLADTLRRKDNNSPLIPNYQALIIDEAHKFLGAARSMYGVELSCMSFSEILDSVKQRATGYFAICSNSQHGKMMNQNASV